MPSTSSLVFFVCSLFFHFSFSFLSGGLVWNVGRRRRSESRSDGPFVSYRSVAGSYRGQHLLVVVRYNIIWRKKKEIGKTKTKKIKFLAEEKSLLGFSHYLSFLLVILCPQTVIIRIYLFPRNFDIRDTLVARLDVKPTRHSCAHLRNRIHVFLFFFSVSVSFTRIAFARKMTKVNCSTPWERSCTLSHLDKHLPFCFLQRKCIQL